jgi:D-amino-acid dehydrogenase
MTRNAMRTLMAAAGEGTSEWMGFRPSMPDFPAGDRFLAESDRVIHAFGHGHLGLTMAGITGRLVADLIAHRTPCLDLSPFRPNRF